MASAYIGIGSNLGDRAAHLELARDELARLPDTRLIAFSSTCETDPLGPPAPANQGKYLNAAAALDTQLGPAELLAHLRAIERKAGRERHTRWAARTLDLDLLLYDRHVIDTPDLMVPHPHMHERRFVLEPLAEIAPHALHPRLNRTARELLDALSRRA